MKQWHANTVFFHSLFLLFYFMLEMFLTFQDTLQLLSIFGAIPTPPPFFSVFPPLISNPSCFVSTKACSFQVWEQERVLIQHLICPLFFLKAPRPPSIMQLFVFLKQMAVLQECVQCRE